MIKATLEEVMDMNALGYKYAQTLSPEVLDEVAINIALMDEFIDKARLRQGFWAGLQTLRRDVRTLDIISDQLRARVEWFEDEIKKDTVKQKMENI